MEMEAWSSNRSKQREQRLALILVRFVPFCCEPNLWGELHGLAEPPG
jgi:hypothetical protein